MDALTQKHLAYYLTGTRTTNQERTAAGPMRPALLAQFADLDELRYDFPLILLDAPRDGRTVLSLSGWFDELMERLERDAELADGSRLRHHAVRLEREIRRACSAGDGLRLSEAWPAAATRLTANAEPVLADSLGRLEAARDLDGEVADCNGALPARLIHHLWSMESRRRTQRARDRIDRLAVGLADILRADDANSPNGTSADRLSGQFGPAFADEFDFSAMSRVLRESRPPTSIPSNRRERLEHLLETLRHQRFFAPDARPASSAVPHDFAFSSCGAAVEAYRQRLPEMIALAKAIGMAELEVDGAYREAVHDTVFSLDMDGLSASELLAFPDYLVTVDAAELSPVEAALLMEAMTAGAPLKVLVQVDDLWDAHLQAHGSTPTGERVRQLAHAAIAIGNVHVSHAPASHLYRVLDSLAAGIRRVAPALFAVYSGAGGRTHGMRPYLVAAAAAESRAFPIFTYDPAAGPDWASRFSVSANPRPELDWTVHVATYEDDELQRVSEQVHFTLVDFLACDERYAERFEPVPPSLGPSNLASIADCVEAPDDPMPPAFPHLTLTDQDGRVHKLLVERRLVQQARLCRERWHSLRELGGVRNSFAERLLAREREAWEAKAHAEAEARAAELAATVVTAPTSSPEAGVAIADAEAAPAVPVRDPDVPLIETPRCSTCDECTKINNRMFKYNQNKQAYIADLSAGTYAEMVLAAERCQVAIIHPGKPWNPDEPGLDELLQRAAPFR